MGAEMQNEWLMEAANALAQNDLGTARTVLGIYTKHFPGDPQGWLLSSRATVEPTEKIAFLKRVLELDPKNRVALSGLLLASQNQPANALVRQGDNPALLAQIPHADASPRKHFNFVKNLGGWGFFLVALIVFALVAGVTVPMFMGYRTLVVLSGSMEPSIAKGGIVLAAPVPMKELKRGDVIVFAPTADAQVPLIHRIVKLQDKDGVRYFTTRGDANQKADVAQVSLPPTAWRVVFTLPALGYLIGWATQPIGTVTLIVIPLLGLVGLKLVDVFKKVRGALVMPAPRNA